MESEFTDSAETMTTLNGVNDFIGHVTTLATPSNISRIDSVEPDNGIKPIIYISLTVIGFILNLAVFLYIVCRRTWKHFVSSHFIAHLMFANLVSICLLLPVFIHDVKTGRNFWPKPEGVLELPKNQQHESFMCKFQAFITCAVWSVTNYMITCVAGVHLLTFARIHYDQLFGLRPSVICLITLVVGSAIGLPCLTNQDIVTYDTNFHYCVWGVSLSGYKFLTYISLLGVALPAMLTWYAYVRVLGILFHSPVVFEALGLYKSRWLVYWFMLSPWYQVPFFVIRLYSGFRYGAEPMPPSEWPELLWFMAYAQCFVSPLLYGASMFIMKEEDMNIQARNAHKGGHAYHAPSILPHQL